MALGEAAAIAAMSSCEALRVFDYDGGVKCFMERVKGAREGEREKRMEDAFRSECYAVAKDASHMYQMIPQQRPLCLAAKIKDNFVTIDKIRL